MKETLTAYEQDWAKAKSKKQKRILIAKDVIAQIEEETIKVKREVYFGNDSLRHFVGKSLKKSLPKMEQPCEVCAIGSMFISVIKATDDFEVPSEGYAGYSTFDSIDEENMRPHLEDYFSEKQLELIETAFEKTYASNAGIAIKTAKEARRALRFGEAYAWHKHRLIAIMENIIENNGTFKV